MRWALGMLGVVGLVTAGSAEEAGALLAPEDTVFYLEVREVADLRARFDAHAIRQVWDEPALEPLMTAYLEQVRLYAPNSPLGYYRNLKAQVEAVPELSWEALLDTIDGTLTVALAYPDPAAPLTEQGDRGFILYQHRDQAAALAELAEAFHAHLAASRPALELRIEEQDGWQVYRSVLPDAERPVEAVAFNDQYYLEPWEPGQLDLLLEDFAAGAREPLLEVPHFVDAWDAQREADLFVYWQIAPWLAGQTAELPELNTFWQGMLGLNQLQGVSLSAQLEPFPQARARLTSAGDGGLLGWLKPYLQPGNMPQPAFLSEGVAAFSISQLDIAGLLRDLRQPMSLTEPRFARMFQSAETYLAEELNLTLEEAVFRQFEPGIVVVDGQVGASPQDPAPPAWPGRVFFLRLRNAPEFGDIVERLLAPQLPEGAAFRDYQGARLLELSGQGEAFLAIQSPYLILGNGAPGLGRMVVNAVADPTDTLFRTEPWERFWRDLPRDVVEYGYQDGDATLVSALIILAANWLNPDFSTLGQGLQGQPAPWLGQVPEWPTGVEFPYVEYQYTRQHPDGLERVWQWRPVEP